LHAAFSLKELLVMSPDHFKINWALVLLRIFALRQVFFASSTLLVTMTTIHTNPATSTSMLVFAITPQMIGIH
jgi:hypothetical protein